MTNLVSAYQRKEINEFEKILKGSSPLPPPPPISLA